MKFAATFLEPFARESGYLANFSDRQYIFREDSRNADALLLLEGTLQGTGGLPQISRGLWMRPIQKQALRDAAADMHGFADPVNTGNSP